MTSAHASRFRDQDGRTPRPVLARQKGGAEATATPTRSFSPDCYSVPLPPEWDGYPDSFPSTWGGNIQLTSVFGFVKYRLVNGSVTPELPDSCGD